ncbi:hypothetical protein LTR48_001799 [Friedmanniomyces endolithicus]|uniref:Uncharacterized protein n=1 Tax=Rachicladosporium monterosium TaxID=1507873 RepID=A0ABR0LCJ8_9PEZI|nr:hypothetical protein LTR29_001027 [Friedmanniomyces endolithicus]KAK1088211.1 hypothetical protein LTR48_001799 [Friedmanniomyces endolithicus]KAK1817792.1 hypothetical protein LTR12_007789 [Friedmanniomyces endolithicus]KAK5146836.1 hypothetical protein LTR32_001629 [Rachicladosporium monterosium]
MPPIPPIKSTISQTPSYQPLAISSVITTLPKARFQTRTKATPTATSKPNPEIGHWLAAALLSIHELELMGEGMLLVVEALPREAVPLGKEEAVPLRKADAVLLMELRCDETISMQSMARVR